MKRLLLSLLLIFTFSSYVFAAPVSSSGVYQIKSAEDLIWFADKVNSGDTSINGKLINNIILTGEWTPIGNKMSAPYSGTFDGNNKKISGLTITKDNPETMTDEFYALFGCLSGSIINLTVEGDINVSIIDTSTALFSGIAGFTNKTAHIKNCTSYVSLRAIGEVGGLYVGGVAGRNAGLIEDSVALGDTFCSQARRWGALVGRNGMEGIIKNCKWKTGTASAAIGDDMNASATVNVTVWEESSKGAEDSSGGGCNAGMAAIAMLVLVPFIKREHN